MKFGKVDNPEEIDFTIPKDHPDTKGVLQKGGKKGKTKGKKIGKKTVMGV